MGIILRIIVRFKKNSGRIIGRFKIIIDLNLMTCSYYIIYTLKINMKTHCTYIYSIINCSSIARQFKAYVIMLIIT